MPPARKKTNPAAFLLVAACLLSGGMTVHRFLGTAPVTPLADTVPGAPRGRTATPEGVVSLLPSRSFLTQAGALRGAQREKTLHQLYGSALRIYVSYQGSHLMTLTSAERSRLWVALQDRYSPALVPVREQSHAYHCEYPTPVP